MARVMELVRPILEPLLMFPIGDYLDGKGCGADPPTCGPLRIFFPALKRRE